MSKINKVIILFFLLSFIILYSGWLFIHSEKFSVEASNRVSEILTKKMGAELNFSGVEFSLIPLSTTFKNVYLVKNDPALLDIKIEARELEVNFEYSSFLSNNLEIDEVKISNGSIDLKINQKSNEPINFKKIKTEEVFSDYLEILKELPVRINDLVLENIDFKSAPFETHVNEISLSPNKSKITLEVDISNFKYAHTIKNLNKIEIDSIKAKATLRSESWRVDYLNVIDGKQSISFKGIVNNEKDGLNLKSSSELSLDGEELLTFFLKLPKEMYSISGQGSFYITTFGNLFNQHITTKADLKDVVTPWIKLQKVNTQIIKNNNSISVIKLLARNNKEQYELRKSEVVFDLKKKKFTNSEFALKIKDAEANTFLYAIEDSLKSLKGSVTGNVYVKVSDHKVTFGIKESVTFADFRLTSPDEKTNILKNKGFTLYDTDLVLNEDMSLIIDAKVLMKNTKLIAVGRLDDESISLSVKDSRIDLTSFGPIADVNLTGHGPVDLVINGPYDNVIFNFKVDWDDFSVVDLNLGKVKSSFSFAINDLLLDIAQLEGNFNTTNYSASGPIGFDDHNEGMDLKVDIKKSNFQDIQKMLHLVFKNITIPGTPELFFQGSYVLRGGFDLDSLDIKGNLRGIDFDYFNEEAERLSFDLSLVDSILLFDNVKLHKSRGELNAIASINLKNDYFSFSGGTTALRLKDFNLYKRLNLEYDGDFNLDFEGSGNFKKFNSKFSAEVNNAFIGNVPVSSSEIVFYLNSDEILVNAKLLGGKILAESLINFSSGVAAIQSSIETQDMGEFLGIISGHNINDNELEGRLKAKLLAQISLGNLGVRKFNLDIEDFVLKKGDINLTLDRQNNKVFVEDGIVRKWNLKFLDGEDYLHSQGRNLENGVIEITHDFSIKANIFEILLTQVERARGTINGYAQFKFDKFIDIQKLRIKGNRHSIKIRNVPGNITDLNYRITKNGDYFELNRLAGRYGDGDFRVNGRAHFKDFYPNLNYQYNISRSRISLFKRSSVLIDSQGTFTGEKPPYKLNGRVALIHGEIIDDLSELMKENKVTIDEYKKFLPERNAITGSGLVDLNINFDIENPIVIKNNMAEVFVRGNGVVTGDMLNPEISTRLETIPGISKFKFKGHDFLLSQGYVEIRDRGKNRFSDLKFTGATNINEYAMKLDLSGSVSNVNIDLSSEPALSKEDLLSLLALGVTSDMSKNLEATERRFVTTVGLGTLLVDQLKINEDLNSTLGLKLSVQPEFKEDETALIQGKSAQSDGSTSRLKSATKIKINKKINEKVDFSVSSTVGGSLEQKQEMNINFNINKNFSIEGVYEVKPNEDENGTTPNSFGADLKWRKSF